MTPRAVSPRAGVRRHSLRLSASRIALVLSLLATGLLLDAVLRDRGELDYDLVRAVQRIDFWGVEPSLRTVDAITGSVGAITLWFAVLAMFAILRRWLAATMLLAFPLLGGINTAVRLAIGRERPDPSLLHGVGFGENDFQSFPSGHVVGAVLLWGCIFFFAGKIHSRLLRWPVRMGALCVIVLSGVSRVWLGAHWVGDALMGYALGGLGLLAVTSAYRAMEPSTEALPLLHSGRVEHDEGSPHAHALTSTLTFADGEVHKFYNPGFLPRLIYWCAFQAPFGYAHNRHALDAAVLRRNLAAALTEYWYGSPRVSPALRVDEVGGRLALVGHYTEGTRPHDESQARAFLFDLAARFDAAGLPTWQIDPRQPRALGNVLETADGTYVVIDLESGLVSPLASPRAWVRALRRGLVPMYDDVFFDVTRRYVAAEEPRMRSKLGDDWFENLSSLLDRAEAKAEAWHRSEPRIWSRSVRALETGFGVRTWRQRIRHRVDAGREHADQWIEGQVAGWETQGRLTRAEAASLRARIQDPALQRVLPHFGVHLVIGIALRFPFGAIARVLYTGGSLFLASVRLALRRIAEPSGEPRRLSTPRS